MSNGVSLGNLEIRKVIFQGDSLLPFLFVLCMVPLSRLNHLLFVVDLKLFAKSNNENNSLVNIVNKFSEDIRLEFGIKKCWVLVLKLVKVDKAKSCSLNLLNGNLIKTVDD